MADVNRPGNGDPLLRGVLLVLALVLVLAAVGLELYGQRVPAGLAALVAIPSALGFVAVTER